MTHIGKPVSGSSRVLFDGVVVRVTVGVEKVEGVTEIKTVS